MKTHLLSFLILMSFFSQVHAQWTIDPANPTIVCGAAGEQSSVQSTADGNGGVYVFWYDERSGNNAWDLYGQHYDADGVAQWEPDGREIINYEGHVASFTFLFENDGNFIFAFAINSSPETTNTGVYVRRIDSNGASIWEDDVKVFDATSYPNSLASARIVKSLDYYYITRHGTEIGGSYSWKAIKIDGDGNLLWPFNGSTPTGMIGLGSYGISSDNNGGFYLYHSTGNGSGAGLRCMLISGESAMQNLWPAWNVVTAGSQGLGYQYSGIGDADGITFVWQGGGPEGTSTNLYARRVQAANGLLGWNEATKVICGVDGEQARFYWKKSGSNYFIIWADGRPGVTGNYAIYAQKFTTNGIILWLDNGVEVANLNTYIPNPEFDLDENNTMCVTHKANTGFVAHKVQNDGTIVWGSGGVVCLSNTYAPFYEDFNTIYSEDKFIVVASNQASVFINKIHPAPVQVSETASACNSYTAHGETYEMSGVYTIEYHPDTILTLNLTIINNEAEVDVDGLTLTAINDGGFQWYNCDTNQPIEGEDGPIYTATESGSYALQLTNGECVAMSECIEITIISVDDVNHSDSFSLFPNPGNEMLIIQSSATPSKPTEIKIVDMQGKTVMHKTFKAMRFELDTQHLEQGIYSIHFITDNVHTSKTWIKTN